ncbi:hypothetical protein Naga_100126g22 [Nannochloropsis gaditana]|uniref:Uncharacterized protein n=1 Tax=Nannochloropsis gaditana TaxID=72520 RepID=W7T846_9STRA|nr:hypothetical protein Naga_100126g22 [Nannochloropsis gaditana]
MVRYLSGNGAVFHHAQLRRSVSASDSPSCTAADQKKETCPGGILPPPFPGRSATIASNTSTSSSPSIATTDTGLSHLNLSLLGGSVSSSHLVGGQASPYMRQARKDSLGSSISSMGGSEGGSPRVTRAECENCGYVFLCAYSKGGSTYCSLDCRTTHNLYGVEDAFNHMVTGTSLDAAAHSFSVTPQRQAVYAHRPPPRQPLPGPQGSSEAPRARMDAARSVVRQSENKQNAAAHEDVNMGAGTGVCPSGVGGGGGRTQTEAVHGRARRPVRWPLRPKRRKHPPPLEPRAEGREGAHSAMTTAGLRRPHEGLPSEEEMATPALASDLKCSRGQGLTDPPAPAPMPPHPRPPLSPPSSPLFLHPVAVPRPRPAACATPLEMIMPCLSSFSTSGGEESAAAGDGQGQSSHPSYPQAFPRPLPPPTAAIRSRAPGSKSDEGSPLPFDTAHIASLERRRHAALHSHHPEHSGEERGRQGHGGRRKPGRIASTRPDEGSLKRETPRGSPSFTSSSASSSSSPSPSSSSSPQPRTRPVPLPRCTRLPSERELGEACRVQQWQQQQQQELDQRPTGLQGKQSLEASVKADSAFERSGTAIRTV